MGFWKNFGKIASFAAPIAAAPFTGGASLALIGAGAGAAGGALSGGGWKGMLTGAGLGAIPGLSGAGKAAGAVAPGLMSGLKQAGVSALTGGGGGMAGQGFWSKYGPSIANIGIQGAGLIGGAALGRQATKNAQQRSPEELAALRGATTAAGDVLGAGKDLLGQSKNLFGQAGELSKQGVSYLQQPANYYQTLLSGNRAAMSGVVAPAVAQITGNYRGAGRALEHSGVRGAARDVASADLNRQRVSQIAGLTTGVQGGAAGALAGLGTETINAASPLYGAGASLAGTAGGMYGTGGNIYQSLLGQGAKNREYARLEGEKTGKAIGAFARDIGQLVGGKTKAGGNTGITGMRVPGGPGGPQMIPPRINTRPPALPDYVGDAFRTGNPWG